MDSGLRRADQGLCLAGPAACGTRGSQAQFLRRHPHHCQALRACASSLPGASVPFIKLGATLLRRAGRAPRLAGPFLAPPQGTPSVRYEARWPYHLGVTASLPEAEGARLVTTKGLCTYSGSCRLRHPAARYASPGPPYGVTRITARGR